MARVMQQPQMDGYPHPPQVVGPNQLNGQGYPMYFGQVRPLKYAQKVARGLGAVQMAIGFICIIFNAILIGICFDTSHYSNYCGVYISGYGIWGGVMFFIPGLLSVLSGRGKPRKCLIIATMVMDIIAACFSAVVFSLGIVDVVIASYGRNYNPYGTAMPYYKLVNIFKTTLALASIMAILAFVQAVISIIGSAFCCRAVCCSGSNAVITNVPYAFTNQQVLPYYPGYVPPAGVVPQHPIMTSAPPYNPTQINMASYDNEAVRHDDTLHASKNSELPNYSPPDYLE